MSNPPQQRISRILLGAARAALTLVVVLVLGLVAARSAQAQTFSLLYSFTGLLDGGDPYATLVRDGAGNLYGTTFYAGKFNAGVVFKVKAAGKETVLFNFPGGAGGEYPFAGLVRDSAGNLYGTTSGGVGTSNGTVFKVSKPGKQAILHNFAGGTKDGCAPYGDLLQDAAGNLYGTTQSCGAFGNGTVFKVSKTGKETVLHSFAGGPKDGATPVFTGLIMDAKGNLYGITELGGAFGNGTVYRLSPSGKVTLLHSFAGGTKDGCDPYGTPAMDKLGNLYGTAVACGTSNVGIVWRVSPTGKETVLHNFSGGPSDGALPQAGVIMDANGNLYGDTTGGGSSGDGTVFKVSRTGKETVLHSFSGPDGKSPQADLIRDAKGTLYGTTYQGGSVGYGTVWQITK